MQCPSLTEKSVALQKPGEDGGDFAPTAGLRSAELHFVAGIAVITP